jgi:Co/Zn/Cd efflux system component
MAGYYDCEVDTRARPAWECSRNDVLEVLAVIATAAAVWVFDSGWPDLAVAFVRLALLLRSAQRVLGNALRALRPVATRV